MTEDLVQAKGIIVSAYPSGEADLILRVICEQHGNLTFIAKHAKRSKSRFSGKFDLFDHGTFEGKSRNSNLIPVSQFKREPTFKKLRDDLIKITVASVLAEVADKLTQEGSQNESGYYFTLLNSLEEIDNSIDSRTALRSLFHAIHTFLSIGGFIDSSKDIPATPKNLVKLLMISEEQSGKIIRSGAVLKSIVLEKLDKLAA